MRGEDDRLGPLEAMLQIGHAPSDHIARPGIDRLRLLGAVVVAGNVSSVRARIDDVRVGGIGRDVSAFAATDLVIISLINSAAGTRVGNGDCRVILLSAIKPVREPVIGGDVIELRRRLVIQRGPTGAAVRRDGRPAVIAVDQALRIVGIDPEAVVVTVRRADGREGLPTVDGAVRSGVEDVHNIGILGVGEDVRVIPCPLTVAAIVIHEFPFLTGIIGAEETSLIGFDQSVNAIRIWRGRKTDASDCALG